MKVLTVIFGALMVITGCVCVAHPMVSAIAIGRFLGILLLVGAAGALTAVINKKGSLWGILSFILLLLGGFTIICSDINALFAVNTLAVIFAIVTLISGIGEIMVAIYLKSFIKNWWVALIAGILNTLIAMLIIVNPFTGFLVVDMMFALEIISCGITAIIFVLASMKPIKAQ